MSLILCSLFLSIFSLLFRLGNIVFYFYIFQFNNSFFSPFNSPSQPTTDILILIIVLFRSNIFYWFFILFTPLYFLFFFLVKALYFFLYYFFCNWSLKHFYHGYFKIFDNTTISCLFNVELAISIFKKIHLEMPPDTTVGWRTDIVKPMPWLISV